MVSRNPLFSLPVTVELNVDQDIRTPSALIDFCVLLAPSRFQRRTSDVTLMIVSVRIRTPQTSSLNSLLV